MRRLLLALVLAAAVAAVPAAQGAQDLKLAFTSYLMVSKVHQKVPGGKPRKGDSIDFKDLLVNNTTQLGKKKGKPTAYDAGTVMYTSPTTQDIAGVTTVPGYGTLTFRGPMTQRKDGTVHIPVVKGTGAFSGAKGMLIVGNGNQKAPNTYVLRLTHPLAPPGSA